MDKKEDIKEKEYIITESEKEEIIDLLNHHLTIKIREILRNLPEKL